MAAYFTGHTRRPKHPIKCFRYVPYALNSQSSRGYGFLAHQTQLSSDESDLFLRG